MNSQFLLIIAMVLAVVAMGGDILWRTIYAKKHNDDEAKNVLTKARALSAFTLGFTFICWEGIATFILGKDVIFTIGRTQIIIMILFGIQCAVELLAGWYYSSVKEA